MKSHWQLGYDGDQVFNGIVLGNAAQALPATVSARAGVGDAGALPPASGTISGTVYNTVVLGSAEYAGTLTILSGASVLPTTYGANAVDVPAYTSNARLANYGTIAGASNPSGAGGAGVYVAGASAMITNAGTITGGNLLSGTGGAGISVADYGATITNTGIIWGGNGSAGVALNSSGALLTNSGSIYAANGNAVLMAGQNNTFDNTGRVGYGAYGDRIAYCGVDLAGSGNALSNTGTIYGYRPVIVQGTNEVITSSGVIYALFGGIGVYLTTGSSATFVNSGQIIGGGYYGLLAAGSDTVIVNRGTIFGDSRAESGIGVKIVSAGTELQNFGTISGGCDNYRLHGYGGTGAVGAEMTAAGTLANTGAIYGSGAGGYGGQGGVGMILADGLLINSGRIFGAGGNFEAYGGGGSGGFGVVAYAGTTLSNSGTIYGGSGGYGLHTGGNGAAGLYMKGGSVTNSGIIRGGSGGDGHRRGDGGAGVLLDGGTLTNSGTIAGSYAVLCGTNAITLIVDPGAVFDGGVKGDAKAADVLQFGGSTAGTASGLGGEFIGFTSVDIAAGANWTFLYGNQLTSGDTLTVAGTLTATGSLSVAGPVFNSGTIASAGTVVLNGKIDSTGMLLATGGGTLNFAQASFQGLSNGVFSGSTLRANAGSIIEMTNNATIVTDSGNITLNGAGSLIEAFSTATHQQVTLDSTLDATTAHGTLSVIDGRNFTVTANGGTFADAGKLVIEADTFTATQLNVSSGGTVMGWGKVSASVTDQGLLAVTKQSLDIIGSLTVDTGTLSIAQGSEIVAGKGITFETSSVLSGPGTLSTTGPVTVTTTTALAIGGGATWINAGSVTDTGAIWLNLAKYDSMAIVNEAGAVFNLASDSAELIWFGYGPGTDSFSNAGTLIKSSGTGTSTVDTTLTNTGLVAASSGTLYLASAVSNSDSLVAESGATVFIAGGLSNTGSVLATSGVIDINSSVANSGTLTASGGTIDVSNYITNTGMLLATSAGTIDLATGSLGNLASGTLTGGTLRANAGSVIELANNTSIVTDQGNITLAGAGAVIESYDASTGKQVLLDSTLSSIAAGGTLSVVSGRNFTATANAGSFTDAGTLILQGVDFSAATLSVAAGGLVSASGTVAGAVVNAGDIVASKGALSFLGAISNTGTMIASAEPLSIGGKVTGAGSMEVGGAGTLTLLQGAGTLQIVDFQAGGAMLDLGAPIQFSAEIAGFGSGDAIDLLSVPATSISYANNVLTVDEGLRTVASLHFQGSYESSDFTLTADGSGGALIRFV